MAKKEASKKETVPEPNTIIIDIEPEVVKIEDVVTPKEKSVIENDLKYINRDHSGMIDRKGGMK